MTLKKTTKRTPRLHLENYKSIHLPTRPIPPQNSVKRNGANRRSTTTTASLRHHRCHNSNHHHVCHCYTTGLRRDFPAFPQQ
ncbi:hypothetical protein L2E82_13809 [Cichorium intybus]|uniref:Uncharacterized protein n=1 Tax=Cichorium intybus TaxID=13427 RepID=A0ACB9EZH5_CICIN|nr:hypothetical protein L2E82_13809 [Cichorium intybus]